MQGRMDQARIIITSSHSPSLRLRSFINDLSAVIPSSKRLTRGKKTLDDLYLEMLAHGADRIVLVEDLKGNPSRLTIYRLMPWRATGPLKPLITLNIKGVTLLREVEGGVRIYNPRSLGVNLVGISDDQLLGLAEALAVGLHGKLVYEAEMAEQYDVIVDTVECVDCMCKILFLEPHTGRIGGPIIKVARAVLHLEEGNGKGRDSG